MTDEEKKNEISDLRWIFHGPFFKKNSNEYYGFVIEANGQHHFIKVGKSEKEVIAQIHAEVTKDKR